MKSLIRELKGKCFRKSVVFCYIGDRAPPANPFSVHCFRSDDVSGNFGRRTRCPVKVQPLTAINKICSLLSEMVRHFVTATKYARVRLNFCQQWRPSTWRRIPDEHSEAQSASNGAPLGTLWHFASENAKYSSNAWANWAGRTMGRAPLYVTPKGTTCNQGGLK